VETISEFQKSIRNSYSKIIEECRSVLGSELHYQAMVYHLLRALGKVPLSQIGMNVKTTIEDCKTDFFKDRITKKDKKFRSKNLEIIPDISFYSNSLKADWRRRNYKNTLEKTIYSLEIKASERNKGRLQFKEIETDFLKLKAQYNETKLKFNKEIGIGMMIIDVAPLENERMKKETLNKIIELSKKLSIDLWYFTQKENIEITY
jgi:hypothetical protein